MTLIKCTECGHSMPDNAKFCPKCGVKVTNINPTNNTKICTQCGNEIPSMAKFCPKCGAKVTNMNPTNNTKICTQCGKEIPSMASFCPKCGTKVTNTINQQQYNHIDEDIQPEIDKFIKNNKQYFPNIYICKISNKLRYLNKDQIKHLKHIKFKNPILILLSSIFLGGLGINRFLIESYVMGFIKVGLLVLFIIFAANVREETDLLFTTIVTKNSTMEFLAITCQFFWIALWIIDIFFSINITKKYNYKNLLKFLNDN